VKWCRSAVEKPEVRVKNFLVADHLSLMSSVEGHWRLMHEDHDQLMLTAAALVS